MALPTAATGATTLFAWLRKLLNPRSLGHVRVELLTRRGCHLCDDAAAFLQGEQRRWGFLLEAKDVDTTPELRAEFGECVPVVRVNGRTRFRGRVNPMLFRRLMQAEAR